jgi:hypothetical protein
MQPVHLTPQVQGRWLSLQHHQYSAVYWFQSPDGTTDDLLTRIWLGLRQHHKAWVLVSILFDTSHLPTDPDVARFIEHLHNSLQELLISPPPTSLEEYSL